MTEPHPPDETPVDRLTDREMAFLLGWGPWLMGGADSLLALCQEADALGLAFGSNPVSRLDTIAALFEGMGADLTRAAQSLRAVAADRRGRVAGGN